MYTKPFLSFEKQVELLQARGLVINDKVGAGDFLASVNYYRFTGYAIPFMDNREHFKNGVVIEDIINVIRLDERLRDLLANALEWIEIDFRTTFAYEHSRMYGATGYMDGRTFCDPEKHGETLKKVKDVICPPNNRQQEAFIGHLTGKYGEVPVWAIVEALPFGNVVHMYKNMHNRDKPTVAKRYSLQKDILGSYIQHILVVRNMCAHHTRLWDKTLYGFRPFSGLPEINWSATDTRKIFYTLLLVNRMTRHIPQTCFDRFLWRCGLMALLKDFQALPNCNPFKIMGIPENGFDRVWWE